MKVKLGLELIGPCSDTGAEPEPHDTIATINDNGRVSFHKMNVLVREGRSNFVVYTDDEAKLHSSNCYLVYIADAISVVDEKVKGLRRLFKR